MNILDVYMTSRLSYEYLMYVVGLRCVCGDWLTPLVWQWMTATFSWVTNFSSMFLLCRHQSIDLEWKFLCGFLQGHYLADMCKLFVFLKICLEPDIVVYPFFGRCANNGQIFFHLIFSNLQLSSVICANIINLSVSVLL